MTTLPLGEVVSFTNGGTPSRKKSHFWRGNIPWVTGADISEGGEVTARSYISEIAVRESTTSVVPAEAVLLLTRTSVGKVGVLREPTAINQDITAITPSDRLDRGYLVHFLRAKKDHLLKHLRGATIKGVTRSDVAGMQLVLPPLSEQRRIAAILDHADALRAKRRQVLAHLDSLTQSIFHDMFEVEDLPVSRLSEIATISSGITKGRRTSGPTIETPYLAVSNVQDGYLRLDAVKTIAATETEIGKSSLEVGDIVLTEGGDPDKLGRGAVWRGEIPLCIHQNHIFRVRADKERILPDLLSVALRSKNARTYFLRSAKRTTGIASINMTQLRDTPIPVPCLPAQEQFVNRVARVRAQLVLYGGTVEAEDALAASLQSRAFRGEL